MTEFEDYYEILGIEQGSSLLEIRSAYRKVALRYHPDKSDIEPVKAADMFRKLTAASNLLSDPIKRATYDKIYTARKNAQKRFEALDSEIRQKRIDLEHREYIASLNSKNRSNVSAATLRQEKIAKIREENKARMMEDTKKLKLHLKSILHTASSARRSKQK